MHPPTGHNTRAALRTLRPLAGYLRSAGHDTALLFAESGIDPTSLFDSSATVPYPQLLDVWRRAEERCGDPNVGLRALERLDISMLERVPHETEWVVLQVFAVSASLGEALTRFARYFPVTFYGSEIVVERAGNLVYVRHRVVGMPSIPRSFSEFILGLIARIIHELTTRPVKPREIRFAHAAPASLVEGNRILPIPPTYAANENAIVLDAMDLSVAMSCPNAALLTSLERHAEERLASLPPLESFVDQIRALIAAELEDGNPNASHIADALQISVRTLSRKLSELGTSHKALLDDVRASLARRYLLDERRAVNETARLLGFSEVSAFHRAFRRWYGRSPTDFRREASSAE
ncbi:MAG: AraC family transcriptional regulator [Polyangiaceae bacterium]|nr:AraC family transcriptional regulator [Polyangiaceae bacterium]